MPQNGHSAHKNLLNQKAVMLKLPSVSVTGKVHRQRLTFKNNIKNTTPGCKITKKEIKNSLHLLMGHGNGKTKQTSEESAGRAGLAMECYLYSYMNHLPVATCEGSTDVMMQVCREMHDSEGNIFYLCQIPNGVLLRL